MRQRHREGLAGSGERREVIACIKIVRRRVKRTKKGDPLRHEGLFLPLLKVIDHSPDPGQHNGDDKKHHQERAQAATAFVVFLAHGSFCLAESERGEFLMVNGQ